jgi:predicted PurR-regulated permease PerM
VATQALDVGRNTFDFLVSLTIMLYLLFFLLRDGRALGARIRQAVPLGPKYKERLFSNFTTVIRATVKGNVLVAIAQGALGGLAFWFLGVQAPLLWAVVMAFLSLLPAVGAALVWAPVAIYFLVTGSTWQGIALILWGTLVIGLVDNFLRPVLVGKDTKLPDYMVLLSTIGGMALFGLNGFVIGPVIAALFVASWDLFVSAEEFHPD